DVDNATGVVPGCTAPRDGGGTRSPRDGGGTRRDIHAAEVAGEDDPVGPVALEDVRELPGGDVAGDDLDGEAGLAGDLGAAAGTGGDDGDDGGGQIRAGAAGISVIRARVASPCRGGRDVGGRELAGSLQEVGEGAAGARE